MVLLHQNFLLIHTKRKPACHSCSKKKYLLLFHANPLDFTYDNIPPYLNKSSRSTYLPRRKKIPNWGLNWESVCEREKKRSRENPPQAKKNNVSFNVRNTFIFNSIINDLLAIRAGYCSLRFDTCVKRFLNYSPFYTRVFSIHVPR